MPPLYILYNHIFPQESKEKTFVEVDENDGVQREIKNEKLSAILTNAPLYVVQTTSSILIIAQNTKVMSINNMGNIINCCSYANGSINNN
jgi:hypothetical protein